MFGQPPRPNSSAQLYEDPGCYESRNIHSKSPGILESMIQPGMKIEMAAKSPKAAQVEPGLLSSATTDSTHRQIYGDESRCTEETEGDNGAGVSRKY